MIKGKKLKDAFFEFQSSTKFKGNVTKIFYSGSSINVFFLGAIVGISIISAWNLIKDISTQLAYLSVQQGAQEPTKFYAIHIGPSKTGSSAIQKNLRSNPFEINTLAEDNLIYVGESRAHEDDEVRKIKGKSVTPKMENLAHNEAIDCMAKILEEYYGKSPDIRDVSDRRLDTDEELRETLRQTFVNKCWAPHSSKIQIKKGKKSSTQTKKFSFDARYMLDHSLMDSSEEYSWFTADRQALGTRFRMFDILGYEKLVVVGAYRRLAEWKMSTYTQYTKTKCLRANERGKNLEKPCPEMKNFLTQRIGNNTSPMYAYSSSRYSNIQFTIPEILEAGPSKLVGKILNFAQLGSATNTNGVKSYQSITTELYCNVLGMELTPNTCIHSQHIEKEASNSGRTLKTDGVISNLVVNEGKPSDTVYQSIIAAGHRLGFILPSEKEIKDCKKKKDTYWCTDVKFCVENRTDCNEIAESRHQELQKINSGGNISIVPQGSNIRTWKDLSDYLEDKNNLTWFETVPIECPSTKWLESLLEKSLEFEELVMPEFYASPLGDDEHKRLFWDIWLKKNKLFCSVNITKLFQNVSSWDEIINDRIMNYNWDEANQQIATRVALKS